jgi:hypothetical protein
MKNILTKVLLGIGLIYFLIILSEFQYKERSGVINWDVVFYYSYLPVTFIYHDVTLNFLDNYKGPHYFDIWHSTTPEGKKIIKTSMGLSILYAPLFLLGHISAWILGEDMGGYSPPYKFWIQIGSMLYVLLGLFVLSKILLKYFSQRITIITILIISLCTNLLHYATSEAAMPHGYNFLLLIVFTFLTIRFYDHINFKNAIFLGLTFGLITLIRPTNIIIILIFLFWNVFSLETLKNRIILLLRNYKLLILIGFFAFLIWVPQLMYWKYITGKLFYFSYMGESFYFNHPQIINGLFSFRKGWLMYTPVMIFSLIGLFMLNKNLKSFRLAVILIAILHIYIVFSWWCWWYGGSFGSRVMIDIYGILAFPLAAFLEFVSRQKISFKVLSITFIVLFSLINIKFYIQKSMGVLHHDAMSKATYTKYFFKFHDDGPFWKMLEEPDYQKALKGIQAVKNKGE